MSACGVLAASLCTCPVIWLSDVTHRPLTDATAIRPRPRISTLFGPMRSESQPNGRTPSAVEIIRTMNILVASGDSLFAFALNP